MVFQVAVNWGVRAFCDTQLLRVWSEVGSWGRSGARWGQGATLPSLSVAWNVAALVAVSSRVKEVALASAQRVEHFDFSEFCVRSRYIYKIEREILCSVSARLMPMWAAFDHPHCLPGCAPAAAERLQQKQSDQDWPWALHQRLGRPWLCAYTVRGILEQWTSEPNTKQQEGRPVK